jgi:hypothetical protein
MVDFVNWYLSDKFYLPVPALLQGESPFFFSYNHLGPYRQMEYTKIPNIALGGEASIVFQVDLRSYLQGLVLVPDWNDVIRTTSWASIDFKTVSESYHWYTFDGWFDGYLDPGDYQVTVAEWTAQNEGHNSRQFAFTAGAGQINRANEIVLDLSGKPIPEFAAFPILAASVAAALIIVRSKPTLRCLD